MEGGRREERAGLVGAEMLFCERADGEDHLWRGEGGRREQGRVVLCLRNKCLDGELRSSRWPGSPMDEAGVGVSEQCSATTWTVGHMATDLSPARRRPPLTSLPGPPHPPPPPPHRPEAWLCRGRPLHARGGQKARAGRLQRLRRRVAAALRAMLGSGEGGCRELDTSAKTLASWSLLRTQRRHPCRHQPPIPSFTLNSEIHTSY